MNKVIPFLYIGGHFDLTAENLASNGITAIVQLFEDREDLNRVPDIFRGPVWKFPMLDGKGWTAEDFTNIRRVIALNVEDQRTVLVCCAAGKSRSAIAVISYLIWRGMSLSRALEHLKMCRPEIDPSIHLLAALMDFHKLHPYLGTVDSKWL